MTKPSDKSTLYRLIDAGLLARQALLEPLLERGLEPGDDAVLLSLGPEPCDRARLAIALGGDGAALARRVARLVGRGLVAESPGDAAGLALTERGEHVRAVLAANWLEAESSLLAPLDRKQRKALDRLLKRILAAARA
jgi:DNA-binding MarR family transcriptional regulator